MPLAQDLESTGTCRRSGTLRLFLPVFFHALGIGGLRVAREVVAFRRVLPRRVVVADLVHSALLALGQEYRARALDLSHHPSRAMAGRRRRAGQELLVTARQRRRTRLDYAPTRLPVHSQASPSPQ